jgi:hypothetical protein
VNRKIATMSKESHTEQEDIVTSCKQLRHTKLDSQQQS